MPRREFVPDERRSLRLIFFVSSMVLSGRPCGPCGMRRSRADPG